LHGKGGYDILSFLSSPPTHIDVDIDLSKSRPTNFQPGVSLRVMCHANCPADLTCLVNDHQEVSFPHKEVPFKMFCSPVKTSHPTVENITESHDNNITNWQSGKLNNDITYF